MNIQDLRTLLAANNLKTWNAEDIDYDMNRRFPRKVHITYEEDFIVVYDKEIGKYILATTWSNQELSIEYLNRLTTIMHIVNAANQD